MKLCQLGFIFLLLCDGPGLTRAQTGVFKINEGTTIKITLQFDFPGNRKIFCKNDCNGIDLLVDTFNDERQNGRYGLQFVNRYPNPSVLSVSIRHVQSSDSGPYWCGLETWAGQTKTYSKLERFIIQVNNGARTSYPTSTLGPAVTSPSYDVTSIKASRASEQMNRAPSDSSPLLWLLLIPVVMVMTSVLLLLICKKKRSQNDEETTVKSRRIDTEAEMYENCRPDLDYQNLSPDTMDPNQTYSTIRDQH